MKRHSLLLSLGATALSAVIMTGSVQAAEWAVAEGMGSVGFSAVQQGSKFTGRFESFTATIDIDPASVESGSIVGTVDTSSVNTRDHDRDAALTDADWFDTANFPEARFESSAITKQDDGSYTAAGELTLKGTSNPINMHFTFDATGDTAKFSGSMTVNRFDYDVGEGWNDTSWVGQDVDVQIELSLTK